MLKVGIVGTGGISQSHLAGWAAIPEAKLVAACDIRPEMVEPVGEKYGCKVYYDLDQMLDGEQLDILDICLPTYLHADAAVKAIGRGLHVLTEKPVSLSREDVRRVYGAAKEKGVRVMVAQVLRFWPEYVRLKEAYDSGEYGKLLSGTMTRLGNTPKWSWDNWMKDPQRSGLVPFDLHIHDLDFMVYTFGAPSGVACSRAGDGQQDYLSVLYQYPGFFIHAEAAWYDCEYPFTAGYRFQFEKAVMEFKEGKLTVYHRDGRVETCENEEEALENGINLPRSNAYYNEIRYFTDCVLAGEECRRIRQEELETVLDTIEML